MAIARGLSASINGTQIAKHDVALFVCRSIRPREHGPERPNADGTEQLLAPQVAFVGLELDSCSCPGSVCLLACFVKAGECMA
jgi:hypothetical protein